MSFVESDSHEAVPHVFVEECEDRFSRLIGEEAVTLLAADDDVELGDAMSLITGSSARSTIAAASLERSSGV